jgi:hypothetical protein
LAVAVEEEPGLSKPFERSTGSIGSTAAAAIERALAALDAGDFETARIALRSLLASRNF